LTGLGQAGPGTRQWLLGKVTNEAAQEEGQAVHYKNKYETWQIRPIRDNLTGLLLCPNYK